MLEQKSVRWIFIASSIFALLQLFVVTSLLFFPGSVLKTVDLNAKGVGYLIYMWAARQFALAFIFSFAVLKRSYSILTTAYIFFLVMNVGDALIGISQKDTSLIVGAGVMCALSSVMLYFINKK